MRIPIRFYKRPRISPRKRCKYTAKTLNNTILRHKIAQRARQGQPSPYAGADQHQPGGRLGAMVLRNQIVTFALLLNVL